MDQPQLLDDFQQARRLHQVRWAADDYSLVAERPIPPQQPPDDQEVL